MPADPLWAALEQITRRLLSVRARLDAALEAGDHAAIDAAERDLGLLIADLRQIADRGHSVSMRRRES